MTGRASSPKELAGGYGLNLSASKGSVKRKDLRNKRTSGGTGRGGWSTRKKEEKKNLGEQC